MGEPNLAVYLAVSFVGSTAAILAWVAEAKKIKVADVSMTELGICKYPSSPASILGYVAASLVLVNQIAISAIARSACRGTNNTYTQKSFVNPTFCFILSWICSGSGIALLISGAYLSGHHEFLASTKVCYTLIPRLFDAGGSMEIIGCTLGLCSAYYFWANCQPTSGQAAPHQDGVALADSLVDAAPTYSNNPKQQQYV